MKKRIISILLALVLLLGVLPVPTLAAADVTLFSSGSAQWPSSNVPVYISSLVLQGTDVKQYNWDGNDCYVTLNSGTSVNASFTLILAATVLGAPQMMGMLSGTANGKTLTFNNSRQASYTGSLVNGKADVPIMIKVQNFSMTKNIHLSVEGSSDVVFHDVTLNKGEGYTIAGDSSVKDGEKYTFTVTVKDTHSGTPVVKANDTELADPEVDGNVYTYTIAEVKEAQNVTVSGLTAKPKYKVTLQSGDGYTIAPVSGSASPVIEGGSYSFTVTVKDTHSGTPEVKANDSILETTAVNGNVYTFTIAEVNEEQNVTVSGLTAKPAYAITLPSGKEFSITPISGSTNPVIEGKNYSFTVTVSGGYEGTPEVKANGNPLSPVAEDGKVYTYTIENVTGPQEITVAGITKMASASELAVNHVTSSGSFDSIMFLNEAGEPIEGLIAYLDGTNIHVILPQDYPVAGKVKAVFTLTQNGSGYPFLSTKTGASGASSSQAVGNKVSQMTTTLTLGAGTATVYYFNTAPNGKNQETFTIRYAVENDPPVLNAGTAAVDVSLPVGQAYTLDLTSLFSDANDISLTYQYKLGNGSWTNCDGNFSYSNELSGEYTLTFRAFDNKAYSEVYTVNLTIVDSAETYPVRVTVPDGIAPEFYVSDETGVVGNVLTATVSGNVYTVEVPSNVSCIAWRADGMGMHTAVSANAELNLVKADFKVKAGGAADTKAAVTVKYGNLTAAGKANSFLLLDRVTYTVKITAGNSKNYRDKELTAYEPINGDNTFDLEQKFFTVVVPAGSVVSAGTLDGSYGYTFVEAFSVETQGENDVYKFPPLLASGDDTRSTVPFIRVQRSNDSDAVTYWRWHDEWNDKFAVDGKTVTITEEMLFMNDDGAFGADTVDRDFDPNDLDIGDIYMNINAQGYLNLNIGGTKQLNMFRNWQAIESYINSIVAQPDFHYEVIDLVGENVVSIQVDPNNSGVANLTATNAGTAIVLVTYDAMYSTKTAKGSGATAGSANQFSAIWPERTGVFVVSVGADGTGIKTNMTYNGKALDAEHNPLFYTGTAGASVSFKPEDGCNVTVSRGTVVDGKLTFGAFVTGDVNVAEDGTVTVSGLTTGRHIIRVEKDGVYTYQVVTTQQVTVEIKDGNNNIVTGETVLTAGDKITVTIKGLTHPAQKLAKIYNYNPFVEYTDNRNNSYGKSTVGGIGSYGFNGMSHSVTITIPSDWDTDTMTLTGAIRLGGYHGTPSGIGAHRNLDYTGRDMGSGTAASGEKVAALPEITLKIKPAPVHASGVSLDRETAELRVTEKVALVATLVPEDTTDPVIWTSSNPGVATVENGIVTAMGVGTTTITVTVGNFSDTCEVKVEAAIEVTGVTLNQQFAKLEPGKQLYLSATVSPENATDKTVIWTSSNTSVATVNANGVVTAVAVGTTTIKATAGNFSAECTVVVEEKEDADGVVTVYLSVSHDGKFIVPAASGKVMVLQKLDVPYFDLSVYGLEAYKIPESDADYGKVTAMHLYIYATEVFYCGIKEANAGKGYLYNEGILGTDVLTISGGAGSSFMKKFWGYDENLNYYLNYQYPVYPGTAIGATSDRIVLKDGDIVTVGHFDNTDFFGDPSSIFNYITVAGGSATVTQNDVITLQLYRAGADMGNGGSNTPIKSKLDVYYAKAGALTSGDVTAWSKLGTTDENGQIQVNMVLFAPGEYVFAVAGRNGEIQTTKICSAPGGILMNVLGSEAGEQVKNVVDMIDAISDPVTLASDDSITAARQAYESLASDALREAVTNYQKLVAAEATLKELKAAKADKDAADAFAALVDKIGTVEATDACKAKIDAAKAGYNALSDTQKGLAATAKTKLDQAETAYANLVADEEDKAAAKIVQDMIAAIQTVTSDSEEKIVAARKAYDALTEGRKPLVENLAVLTAAEKKLAQMKEEAAIDAVEKLIDSIGTVTLEDEKAIEDARKAYAALTVVQQEKVENYKLLTDAEALLAILKMNKADVEKVYQTTGDYLEKLVKEYGLTVNSIGGEWIVVGLERAGRDTPNADAYYQEVLKFVKENINDKEQLHRSKATENARVILALSALGYDVTDVDGHNLLLGLTDMTYVKKQGINGPIWTLIAFDSHDYEIPSGGNVTREELIKAILDRQLADGGWALSGTKADADMTGMALAALAPYYKTNSTVKAAVDKALTGLSQMQHDDGGFGSVDGASAESAAQVIVALTALGIDPHTDSRFVKNGRSVVDALCDYYVEGGGFKHVPFLGLDGMASEQGYYALAAYFRFKENKTGLYDMSDVVIESKKPVTKVEITEGGITAVPDSLKEAGFNAPEAVKQEMVQAVIGKNKEIDRKNVAHYDVTLMYSEDGGKTWIKADETHFPANGKITVTIPYPAGTDSSYNFTVVHMFTSDAFGKTPGDVEMPKVTKTKDGIQFEVTGLSPISVGWTAPDTPQTGDNTNIALYTSLMLVSVAGLAALLVADRKRKYAGKYGK